MSICESEIPQFKVLKSNLSGLFDHTIIDSEVNMTVDKEWQERIRSSRVTRLCFLHMTDIFLDGRTAGAFPCLPCVF